MKSKIDHDYVRNNGTSKALNLIGKRVEFLSAIDAGDRSYNMKLKGQVYSQNLLNTTLCILVKHNGVPKSYSTTFDKLTAFYS